MLSIEASGRSIQGINSIAACPPTSTQVAAPAVERLPSSSRQLQARHSSAAVNTNAARRLSECSTALPQHVPCGTSAMTQDPVMHHHRQMHASAAMPMPAGNSCCRDCDGEEAAKATYPHARRHHTGHCDGLCSSGRSKSCRESC